MKKQYDVIIIGGGTAGLSAYRQAKQYQNNALLVEKNHFKTTCANVGCMPSKLLISAAHNAHDMEKGKEFGVLWDNKKIDGKQVMKRVKVERDRFVGFVLEGVESIPDEDKLIGSATIINRNTVDVDGVKLTTKAIVIATGSRPVYPSNWNKLKDRLIINDDVFEWDDLPKSVAIFGAGVIGLEIGQALHYLGVRVKLFSRGGRIAGIYDDDIRQYTINTINDEFYCDVDAKVKAIEKKDNKVEISYHHKETDELTTEKFDYLLAATGRRPNIENIGLENVTIKKDIFGIPEMNHDTMQTSIDNIFIAGDVNNEFPILHEASDQGKIAGKNAALFPYVEKGLRREKISIVFSNPQIMRVGLSILNIQSEYDYKEGIVSFENQGRSRVMLKNKGVLKVFADNRNGRLLGAEMIGPDAEHIAHLLAWSIQMKMTIKQLLEMPFYHPVVEEGVRTALQDVIRKLDVR